MKKALSFILTVCLTACSLNTTVDETKNEAVRLFPDYTDITIPYNIAPLNFSVSPEQGEVRFAVLEADGGRWVVEASDGQIAFPVKKWHAWLERAKGKTIRVTVVCRREDKNIAYLPYSLHVAAEPIDRYIAYRLIEPGYEVWNRMGIYQRDLETFKQTPILENKITENNCVNCHSFCNRSPEQYVFHMRASLGGTVLKNGDMLEILDTKAKQTLSSFTYPYWHPSGRFIAFSINKTTQGFHPTQRVEVYDVASDVIVYDIKKHKILSVPQTSSAHSFETFPSFSPDGKYLYFCSAPAKAVPDSISELRYNLCRLAFDAETGTLDNNVDTLFYADQEKRSFSFPRVSPDGRFLMGTVSAYGTFPIWHKDADLYLMDLQARREIPILGVNSLDTESYHSWSSNGRWVVFSSRRLDGLYTRLFFSYVSASGEMEKPFLLPLLQASENTSCMKSFNIPEFVTGKVKNESMVIRALAEQDRVGVSVE